MPDTTPDWRAAVRARLASSKLHPQDEAELVEEVAQHLEEQFAELAPSLGARAARDRLLAQLADPELDAAVAGKRRLARPASVAVWSSASLLRDIRHGFRSLRRSPGMMAAGTAALALGIGLTTMMFSIIYGTLIKGPPFTDASRIGMAMYFDPAEPPDHDQLIPEGDFLRIRGQQHSFDLIGALAPMSATATGGDRPVLVSAARLTASAFEITGASPLIGRALVPRDNAIGAPPVAVLGYTLWRDRYAADSAALGKAIKVDGASYTIVGVMPDGFRFPDETDLWLPLQLDGVAWRAGEGSGVTLVGRLREGVSFETANVELANLSARIRAERGDTASRVRAIARPFVKAAIRSNVFSLMYGMLVAVFLVLLVACANVANLLLHRAASRTREIGIRTALGASRLAVVRQSLVESSLIAALAAVVGSGLAHVGIVAFNQAIINERKPFWMDIRLHPEVLLFVVGISVLASIVSGVLPAIQSAKLDVSSILKDESHSASAFRIGRLSRWLVIAEIALSSMLLVGAGFMTKSLAKLRNVDTRFTSAGVFTASVMAPPNDTTRQHRLFAAVERELAARPGVQGVYVGSALPGTTWGGGRIALEGRTYERDREMPSVRRIAANPGFFATFEVPVLRGRGIEERDRMGAPRVAVVSESFVRRHFADADPIGRRFRFATSDGDGEWLTIVGVIPTLYVASLQNPFPPEVITSFGQTASWPQAYLAVRGGNLTAESIAKIVATVDPEAPVFATATLDDVLVNVMLFVHLFGTMFVVFGVVSLVLAVIGLYAVMAFSVSRRVREMGIRLALGATSRDVILLVCRQGAVQILIGMSVGLAAGVGVARLIRAGLFQVDPADVSVYGTVSLVLAGAALVACLVPAQAATKVDPAVTLRSE